MLTIEPGLPDRHVVLIGARGAGTSTVGRLLAARFHRRFLDQEDHERPAVAHQPAADAPLASEPVPGADLFLDQLGTFLPAVIAVGLVAIDDARVRAALDGRHAVVWLDGDPEILARRAGGALRRSRRSPGLDLAPPEVYGLRAERCSGAADLIVDVTAATPATVVDQVVAGLGTRVPRRRTRPLAAWPGRRTGPSLR